MKGFLSFNITRLIFAAAFLFVLNQNIAQKHLSSAQMEENIDLIEHSISSNENDKLQNKDSKTFCFFGIEIEIEGASISQIKLGQLQLTLSDKV